MEKFAKALVKYLEGKFQVIGFILMWLFGFAGVFSREIAAFLYDSVHMPCSLTQFQIGVAAFLILNAMIYSMVFSGEVQKESMKRKLNK